MRSLQNPFWFIISVYFYGLIVIKAYLSPLKLYPPVIYTSFVHSNEILQDCSHVFHFHSCRKQHGSAPLLMVDDTMSSYDEEPVSSIGMKRLRPIRPRILQDKVNSQLVMKQHRQIQDQFIAQSDPTLLSNTSFAFIPEIHSSTKRVLIEYWGFKSMTEIQAQSFYPILSGVDVVGRARTGTGKTLAYVVPSLERLFHLYSIHSFQPNRDVGMLILSPIRELATQIADQIETLLHYPKPTSGTATSSGTITLSSHHPRSMISVQVLSGATSIGKDIAEMNQRVPSIIVATPGRLLEHIEETRLHNGRHFGREIIKNTNIVIFDEADRLLSMGFQKDIEKIISYLPRKEKRQTLLFSATIPLTLRNMIHSILRESFIQVDCVGRNGVETNIQVNQSHIIMKSIDEYITSIVHIIHHLIDKNTSTSPSYKMIVFFPTARLVTYFAQLFQLALGIPVLELHSKKSPGHRHRVHDTFRHMKQGILFTSDVTSRGIDYPDVTCVIQFGLPESREQYIHRLGRTGRAGNIGSGLLILSPFESLFLQQLKGLDVNVNTEMENLLEKPPLDINDALDQALDKVRKGSNIHMQSLTEQAYQSILGYYVDKLKATSFRSKDDLVQTANRISLLMGLPTVPHLSKDIVHKMGLTGTHGIMLAKESESNRNTHVRDGRVEHDDGRHRLG